METKEQGSAELSEFEAALQDAPRGVLTVRQGDEVAGTVVSVAGGHVFVDIGAKSEAAIAAEELLVDGELKVSVGDSIEGFVVSVDPELVISQSLSGRSVDASALEDAQRMGLPVRGTVTGVNKGGLEVEFGGVRGFCPLSQIELRRCEEPEAHLSQSYDFKVVEVKDGGRSVVVSRRALLEEQQQEEAAGIREKIVEGAELVAEVASIQAYGAFVDLGGGIQGMVHISEVSRSRLDHPDEVLVTGQQVRVKVLKVEPDPKRPKRLRIALSMKALQGDPWAEAQASLSIGSSIPGKVVRLQPFGAFVELLPGVDGLIHISELSDRRIGHPSEVVTIGQDVEVTVLNIDQEAKRISLSLRDPDTIKADNEAMSGELTVGEVFQCQIDKIKPFGLLVRYRGPGRGRGLIPAEDTGLERGADLRRAFKEGDSVEAEVTDIDPEGKVKFSIAARGAAKERADFRDYLGQPGGGGRKQAGRNQGGRNQGSGESKGGGFGTLGDLLNRALKKD